MNLLEHRRNLINTYVKGIGKNTDPLRDDAPYIQRLINTKKPNAEGIKIVNVPATNPASGTNIYQIGSTIVLDSNTTIRLNNCTLRLNDGVLCNVFASEGLHETGATAADELQNIKIIGVGDNATLDGGKHNGVFEGSGKNVRLNHFIWFKNVDGFEISNLKIIEQRHWAICFNFCENGKIHDIEFDCKAYSEEARNQDGIDLRHGCNNIEIYNITGNTGDDTIALTTLNQRDSDYNYRVSGKSFDIHDIKIHNVKAAVNGYHSLIRLLAHNGCKIYDVDIKDIVDTTTDNSIQGVLRIGDKNYYGATTGGTQMAYGDINNITIDGVTSNKAAYVIYVGFPERITTEHVHINNIKAPTGSTPIYTNLPIAEPAMALSDLEGTSIYKIDSTDAASGANNFNAKLKNNSAKNVNLNYSVTFNGVSSRYAIYPLGVELQKPLQLWTSNFSTADYNQVRAKIRVAQEFLNDPLVNDFALYYSTDNGATWSSEPISFTRDYNGQIATYNNTAYHVWTFTTVDITDLTNQPITNLKLCPHGEQTLIRGAFRLLSMDVKGVG